MTREEAQAEAVRRWGEEGAVYELRFNDGSIEKRVGTYIGWIEEGEGGDGYYPMGFSFDSWESAFADADRREGSHQQVQPPTKEGGKE